MFGDDDGIQKIFPGRACEVSFRPSVAEGEVILTAKNSVPAVAGAHLRVTVEGKRYYLTATIVAAGSPDAYDNIQIRGPVATKDGRMELVSERRFKLHKALHTPKSRASLFATILSVLSAAGAAVNSAQHASTVVIACTGLRCVSPISWLLVILSAISAGVAWWKDNLTAA